MKPSNVNVRMKDVADALGYSTMTVSLALRNNPRIPDETRKKIIQQADKMGYRPNPFVASLVAWRKNPGSTNADTLVVLTKFGVPPGEWKRDENKGFYRRLWKGLEARAAELGFHLEEIPSTGVDDEGRTLTRILRTRGIRGVILFPGGKFEQDYPALDWKYFVPVAIAFHSSDLPVHRVASNHSMAIDVALHYLDRRGYRRPGLMLTPTFDARINYAMTGRFLAWQHTVPKSRRVPLIEKHSEFIDQKTFSIWLGKYRPDVILSPNADHYHWLQKIGPKFSNETAFIHLAKEETGSLSGVDLRTTEAGRTVIDILARELYLNRFGIPEVPELILVSCEWREGNSLPHQTKARQIS
jgi:LacI family transcriptional regulator